MRKDAETRSSISIHAPGRTWPKKERKRRAGIGSAKSDGRGLNSRLPRAGKVDSPGAFYGQSVSSGPPVLSAPQLPAPRCVRTCVCTASVCVFWNWNFLCVCGRAFLFSLSRARCSPRCSIDPVTERRRNKIEREYSSPLSSSVGPRSYR